MKTTAPIVAVVARESSVVESLSQNVAQGLGSHGFNVSTCRDGDPALLKSDIVLVLGSVGSMRRTVSLLERNPNPRRIVVMWVFEPLPARFMSKARIRLASHLSPVQTGKAWTKPVLHLLTRPLDYVLHLPYRDIVSARMFRFLVDTFAMLDRGQRKGWLNHVVTSTEEKRLYLESHGISAQFLPVGQQPFFGKDMQMPRDIDVLFIGSLKSKRRRRELDQLRSRLAAYGLKTHIPDGPVWGEARAELVNRTKVLLHIHNFEWDTPWMRWNLAAANGAAVASQPLSVPYPMRPGIDYLSAPAEDLAAAIRNLVQDETRCQQMVRTCQATISEHMTAARSIALLAQKFETLLQQRG
ncbi:hypothetical protein [Celeribacter sp.]|uniref:glycosyltransferase family protein n=1 Tax=Celeribacter sp. TaxID=1890673 RepID=UPI003A921A36